MTLAEKMGIFEAPPGPMDAEQWRAIEERSRRRKDHEGECVICLNGFRGQQQVILSCSHIFHKACLHSFERHNRMKACPICRLANYQEKDIIEGVRNYALACVLRIQAHIRMHRQNTRFFEALIHDGYKPRSDAFGRRLVLFKMARLSSKLRRRTLEQHARVQQFLQHIETVDRPDAERLFEELLTLHAARLNRKKPAPSQELINWKPILEKARSRKQPCAICLGELDHSTVTVLCCSHAFHRQCIQAFERYGVMQRCCPNCRKEYAEDMRRDYKWA
jgi:hypothetical protein